MRLIGILCIFVTLSLLGIIMPGCSGTETPIHRYLPPKYLSAIEISAYDLVQAYQHPAARVQAEALLNDRVLIVKDIEITEEIVNNSTETYLNWGHSLFAKPSDISDLDLLNVGNKVDVVGICLGIPTGKMAVVLDQCIMESAGIIPLPLTGDEDIGGQIY